VTSGYGQLQRLVRDERQTPGHGVNANEPAGRSPTEIYANPSRRVSAT